MVRPELSSGEPAICLRGLRKSFGGKVAVDDLDLDVPRGALYGLIGPNGAGKTTAIRMVMSILFADCGEVSVLGCASALAAKDRIGYLPEERGLYKRMRVEAFLRYVGTLKGLGGADLERRVGSWLDRVGLAHTARKRCDELSKGMQQKVEFIAAVLHGPELLILDEPFSGLDPISTRLLRELIRAEHERGATVVFSTHGMAQAEEICDHVVMIHRGRKVLDDPLPAIRARHDPRVLLVEPAGAATPGDLAVLPAVAAVAAVDGLLRVTLAAGVSPQAGMAAVAAAVPAVRLEVHRPSLEDVFVEIVTGEDALGEEAQALRRALAGEDGAGPAAAAAGPGR